VILVILLIAMFNEFILNTTPLTLYSMQCKTQVTCSFPSFSFILQFLSYAKAANIGILLKT